MTEILAVIEGTLALIDDVLVLGTTQEEHNERLEKVLSRIKELNEVSMSLVQSQRHIIDSEGIRADPEKTSAID